MAKDIKLKIFENVGTKIYMDAKDKNVSANVIYSKHTAVGNMVAFQDHDCTVGYDADRLLEAFVKGALVCFLDEHGGETLCTPVEVYKNDMGVTVVSYPYEGGFSKLFSIEGG